MKIKFLERQLNTHAGKTYLLLRVVSGAAFMFHGLQKIAGFMTDHQPAVMSQMWIGGVIELVAGAMIMSGIFTRLAAFLASGTMAVAYMQFHWKFQFDANFFPAVNKGEPALIYCFLFLYIACQGSRISRRG